MADLPLDAPDRRVSRRSVVSIGLAGLGLLALEAPLSGCSSDTPQAHARGGRAAQTVTPDVRTATAALTAVRATHEAVRATARKFPATASTLAGFAAMHAAHERSLVDAVPEQARTASPSTPYVVPGRRTVALSRLQASEARLHDTLQGLAERAQSGDFARLLASMASGISVHRAAAAKALS